MADAVLYPSGEDRVCAAVALGWQVAVLYHSPVHRGPVADPPRAARLPGYSGFSPATHARWLGEQIAATAGRLVTDSPQALTEALSGALAWLDAADREREATLNAIFTLHCRLLEALNVTDFRLGKAYGLGRALAETSLVPAGADVGWRGRCVPRAAGERTGHHAQRLAGRTEDPPARSRRLRGDQRPARLAGLGGDAAGRRGLAQRAESDAHPGTSVAGAGHRREGGDGHAEPVRLPGRGPADRLALPVGDSSRRARGRRGRRHPGPAARRLAYGPAARRPGLGRRYARGGHEGLPARCSARRSRAPKAGCGRPSWTSPWPRPPPGCHRRPGPGGSPAQQPGPWR